MAARKFRGKTILYGDVVDTGDTTKTGDITITGELNASTIKTGDIAITGELNASATKGNNSGDYGNCQMVRLSTITATASETVFVADRAVVITGCKLIADTTVATDETDYWTINLVNVTQAKDLLAAGILTKTTGGAALTADTVREITPDQNATIAANDVIQLECTDASGSAADIVTPKVAIFFRLA